MTSLSSSPSLNQFEIELMEVGRRLLVIPSSKQELLDVLQLMEHILCRVEQLGSKAVQCGLQLSIGALTAKELVRHPDMDVKISVACCISEILRITAPNPPCSDEKLKEFFELAVITFEKLPSTSGRCCSKLTAFLKTFSEFRLPVLMLDLQLDELIFRMFQQFLNAARSNCCDILLDMENIMTRTIEESEQLTLELISLLVTSQRKENQNASSLCCWLLGRKVLKNCAVQLKPYLPDVMRHMDIALHDFAELVAVICDDAPGSRSMEAKEPAPDHNSLGESNPRENDRSKVLMKDTVQMSTGELTKFGKSSVSTVRSCQQATEHTVNLPAGNSRKELGDSSAADYQGLNSESGRKKMKIKPNPLIQKPDHTGKVFLTSRWRDHEKKILSSSKNPATSSKAEREGKRRKRKYTPAKKKASKMAQGVEELGDNLVGSRIKVWCPMDQMFYEGIIASFDHSTKKHEVCYTDGDEESLHLKEERWELVEALGALPDSGERATPVASPRLQADSGSQTSRDLQVRVALPTDNVPLLQSEIDVQGYKMKASTAPILESIFAKHGDIAAQCMFKTAAVRATFLEVVCDVVGRLQTNDVAAIFSEMETIESEVSEAEAANIEVSWLRPYLEPFRSRKEASQRSCLLMDTKKNTMLVNKAARRDLRDRNAELVAAQERFKEAERQVKLLDLVERKLNHDILESTTEEDSWRRPAIL